FHPLLSTFYSLSSTSPPPPRTSRPACGASSPRRRAVGPIHPKSDPHTIRPIRHDATRSSIFDPPSSFFLPVAASSSPSSPLRIAFAAGVTPPELRGNAYRIRDAKMHLWLDSA